MALGLNLHRNSVVRLTDWFGMSVVDLDIEPQNTLNHKTNKQI